MRGWTGSILVLAGMALACMAAPSAGIAAEIKVLTAGAIKPVLADLVPRFEAETGHKVRLENDTAGALVRRVGAGEAFDVLVLTPAGLADLADKGRVLRNVMVPLARVGIGVAVREGMTAPDISTVEAFRGALRRAGKVAMIDPAAGGSSGIYLARLFERWGIAQEIAAKSVLVPGGLVATRVVSGEADLAIHQISEILAVKGATLVGPLPEEIQSYTVYAGSIAPDTRAHDAAAAFLARASGHEAQAGLAARGMMPAKP